jgi:hypothetical protein
MSKRAETTLTISFTERPARGTVSEESPGGFLYTTVVRHFVLESWVLRFMARLFSALSGTLQMLIDNRSIGRGSSNDVN